MDVGQLVVGFRVVGLRGLAEEDERPDHLAFVEPEHAAEEVGHAETGVQLQGVRECILGLFDHLAAVVVGLLKAGGVVEVLREVAPDGGLIGVRLRELANGLQCGLVLAHAFLPKCLLDLRVKRGAAPLELLAAAAGARNVGIEGHWRSSECGGEASRL